MHDVCTSAHLLFSPYPQMHSFVLLGQATLDWGVLLGRCRRLGLIYDTPEDAESLVCGLRAHLLQAAPEAPRPLLYLRDSDDLRGASSPSVVVCDGTLCPGDSPLEELVFQDRGGVLVLHCVHFSVQEVFVLLLSMLGCLTTFTLFGV